MKSQANRAATGTEILVVEDSPTQMEQLRHILEQRHYTVTTAGNGKQALACLADHQPALVISDIVMPEMSGYELCQRIKADKGTQDTPVILLTSLSSTQDVLEGLACGADSIITKPYRTGYLASQVEQTLAGRLQRNGQRVCIEVESQIGRPSRSITADAQQMFSLLCSAYDAAVDRNSELLRAQELLRESEERFRAVAETAGDAIITVDDQGNIVFWNPAAERMFGYVAEDAAGKPLNFIMPERFGAAHQSGLQRMVATGAPRLIGKVTEVMGIRKDGSEFALELSLAAWHSGDSPFFTAICRDISERKRAEELLRESEAQYRLLADHMQDTVWLMDTNLQTTYISPSVQKSSGFTLEEIQQLPLHRSMSPASLQSALELFSQEMPKALADPAHRSMGTLELEFYCKDGTKYWSENTFSIIRDESGRPVSILSEGRDISERRRAEDTLRQSEQRYRSLFDGVPIGLYRTSPQGQFIDANPALARLLGYPDRAALRATNAADAYADARERERWRSTLERGASARDREHEHEVEVLRPDGSVIWVRDNARAVRDPDGKVLYFEGSLEDISERKQAEEVLRSQSLNDDLTGLYNRRGFLALADQQMKLVQRRKSGLFLFFADLDGMKRINDTLGHEEGDRALMAVAAMLKNAFRKSDIVARLGGDEFAVLALDTAADAAATLASRLQDALDAHNARAERGYTLSLSVGLARYDPLHPCSVHELLARADSLMYEQKRGKNR